MTTLQQRIYTLALYYTGITKAAQDRGEGVTIDSTTDMLCHDPDTSPYWHTCSNGAQWIIPAVGLTKERRGWVTKMGRVTEWNFRVIEETGLIQVLGQTIKYFGADLSEGSLETDYTACRFTGMSAIG